MPSILVVEHEGRYIERIQDALSAEGWQPRFVAGRPEALRAAASEAPHLVLVNAELPGAAELLRSFARRNGGPGAVALVPERGAVEGLEADEILAKPFTDQDLRLVVRRGLAGSLQGRPGERPAAGAGGDDHKLTSQEIFGDLLAEVEDELAAAGGEEAADLAADAAEPPAAGEPPGPTTPPPTPAAAGADPREGTAADIERRIEKTLSGLFDTPPRPAAAAGGAPAARRAEGAAAPAARPPRDEVDELLDMTLSSLELEKRRSAAARRSALEGEPIDLSELEALAGHRGRRPRPPAAATAEPPATAPAPVAAEGPDEAATAEAEVAASHPAADAAPAAGGPGAEAADAAAEEAAARGEREGGPVAAAEGPEEEPAVWEEEPAVWEEAAEADGEPDEAAAEPAEEAVAETAAAAGEGRRFGHYTLLERIAVGGMAEVWKARMTGVEGFQKTVAIKKILPHMTDHADFVSMFIDEAKLAAQLNHPNITHIYDLGKLGDDYYIAMEYVEGRNLRAILNDGRRQHRPLPVGLALLIAARLAAALDYAHRKRDFDDRELELVHRDVSPQNVLISDEGDIKLCDFGISKAVAKVSQTETGALKGKLQYMSPEQAWGKPVDARSDIFSLGTLLFEMLTGQRLFTGDSELSVLEAVRDCRVRSPREVRAEVPAAADALVLRALAARPEDRFATAGAMRQELDRILHDLKPMPNPGDLTAYLAALAGGGEGAAAAEEAPAAPPEEMEARVPGGAAAAAAAPPAAGTGSAVRVEAAAVPPGAGGDGEPAEEPAAERTGSTITRTDAWTGTWAPTDHPVGSTPALASSGAVEVEEGGSRGRWLLVAGILLLVAVVVAAWLLFGRPAPATPAPAPGASAPAEPTAGAAPAPVRETAPEAGPPAGAASGAGAPAPRQAGAVQPAAAPPESGPTDEELSTLIDQELARREEKIRAEYESRQRRLEAEIARVREAAPPPATTPPAAGAAPTEPEPAEPPPADTAPPAAGSGDAPPAAA